MRQYSLGGQKSALLVQNAVHILVCRNESFHQHVSLRLANHLDCLCDSFYILGFGNYLELVDIQSVTIAHLFNPVWIADQCGVDEFHIYRIAYRFKGMRILAVGNHKTFASASPGLCYNIIKRFDHNTLGCFLFPVTKVTIYEYSCNSLSNQITMSKTKIYRR